MNTKDFFGMLLMVFLAVAGLTACSDNDNDNLTNIAETEWVWQPCCLHGYQ